MAHSYKVPKGLRALGLRVQKWRHNTALRKAPKISYKTIAEFKTMGPNPEATKLSNI